MKQSNHNGGRQVVAADLNDPGRPPAGRVLVPDEDRHVDRDLITVYCPRAQQEFVLLWDSECCPFCEAEVGQ